jgi:hypothetical protein
LIAALRVNSGTAFKRQRKWDRRGIGGQESRPQESVQDDKWSFCLTAGTLCPANQERQ